jgi:hypothetical protein
MGIIGMTFLGRPFSFMFYNFIFFFIKSLKLINTFMGGCIVTSFYVHLESIKDTFSTYPMLMFTIFSVGYKFLVITTFIPLYILKKGVKH